MSAAVYPVYFLMTQELCSVKLSKKYSAVRTKEDKKKTLRNNTMMMTTMTMTMTMTTTTTTTMTMTTTTTTTKMMMIIMMMIMMIITTTEWSLYTYGLLSWFQVTYDRDGGRTTVTKTIITSGDGRGRGRYITITMVLLDVMLWL